MSVPKIGRSLLFITLIVLVLGVLFLAHHQRRTPELTPDASEKLHQVTSESRSTVDIGAKAGTKPSRNPRTSPETEAAPPHKTTEQKHTMVPEGTHREANAELRKESGLAASIERLFETASEGPTVQDDSGNISTGWATVTIGGVEYTLKPGEVLEIVEQRPGTANPRPRTPEEQRRYNELAEESQRFGPEIGPEDMERLSEIQAEIDRINAETLPLSYTTHRVSFTITKNPPGGEE